MKKNKWDWDKIVEVFPCLNAEVGPFTIVIISLFFCASFS